MAVDRTVYRRESISLMRLSFNLINVYIKLVNVYRTFTRNMAASDKTQIVLAVTITASRSVHTGRRNANCTRIAVPILWSLYDHHHHHNHQLNIPISSAVTRTYNTTPIYSLCGNNSKRRSAKQRANVLPVMQSPCTLTKQFVNSIYTRLKNADK